MGSVGLSHAEPSNTAQLRSPLRSPLLSPLAGELSMVPNVDLTEDLPTDLCMTVIPPRSFNTLSMTESLVTKTSTSSSIRGELHFYLNIPPQLSSFFPTLRAHTLSPSVSFTVDRVRGPTLSTLMVENRLTARCVVSLLHTLHRLHSHAPAPPHTALLYANHHAKVAARFQEHMELYQSLQLTMHTHFDSLLKRLLEYEVERRAIPVGVVHGDPVMTNVLLHSNISGIEANEMTKKNTTMKSMKKTADANVDGQGKVELRLIDMRGALGDVLTLAGDAVYDLAKVLQSLLGYDLVLAEQRIDAAVGRRLSELLQVYWETVQTLYPTVRVQDIVLVTCSLFSSLIPLHDDPLHRRLFAVFAATLLEELDGGKFNWTGESLVRRITFQLAKATS